MTTSTAQDTRYPLPGIIAAITAAMEGTDCTSTAEWVSPDSCRCRRENVSCLDVQARANTLPGGVHECQGYAAHIPVSPGKALTPEDLINALPGCDSQGMVSGNEVAAGLQAIILDRIAWQPVWLSSITRRLAGAFGELEESLSGGSGKQDAGKGGPVCQVCAGKLPPGSRSSRRTCGDRCRQRLRQQRLRSSRQPPVKP